MMQNVASRNTNPQPDQSDRITIDEVLKREAAGETFTYIDVRNPQAYEESDVKVAGALRIALDNADKQISDVNKDRPVITYCT
jgi:rhodanese-related sulfurtransferase